MAVLRATWCAPLLLVMVVRSLGQTCTPVSNSHGPIVPNTDLPTEGVRLYFQEAEQVIPSYLMLRASQIEPTGFRGSGPTRALWCQSANSDSNNGMWFQPPGNIPPGFSEVSTSDIDSPTDEPYQMVTCPGQVGLVRDTGVASHEGLLQCMIRDESNNTHTLTVGVYTGTVYDNYIGPVVDTQMQFNLTSTRDADPPVFTLTFTSSYGPPSEVECAVDGNTLNTSVYSVSREVTAPQFVLNGELDSVNNSMPDTLDMTRVTVTAMTRQGGIYVCNVTVMGRNDSAPKQVLTLGTGVTTINITSIGSPTNVLASWTATEDILVTWSTPATPSTVSGYEVFYKTDGSDPVSGGTTNGSTLTITLTGLTFGNTYSIFVVAYGGANTIPSDRSTTVSPTLPTSSISVDQGTPLLAGTSRSLSCSINSPLISGSFAWMKNGSPVNTSDSRITVNSTTSASTLQFNPLRTSDGGQYQCVATIMIGGNSVNPTDELDLNVTIPNSTVAVTIATSDDLWEGDSVSLACVVNVDMNVDTDVTIMRQWMGPDLIIAGPDYSFPITDTNDTLHINQLTVARDNNRVITCVTTILSASGSQFILQSGTTSGSTQLNVQVVRVSFGVQGTPHLAGTTQSLVCSVSPNAMSTMFVWKKDGSNLEVVDDRVTINNTLPDRSILLFNPLRTSDGDRYQCFANVAIGGSTTNGTVDIDLSVTISIADVIVTTTPNLTLYEVTPINITCNVMLSDSVDTNTTITYQWLGPTPIATDTITDDTLSINQLTVARDNGRTITCMATVTVSSLYVVQSTANGSTQLTVAELTDELFAPDIIIPGVPTAGDNFNIICRLDGVVERLVGTPLVSLSFINSPGGSPEDLSRDGSAYIRPRTFNPGKTSEVGTYICAATVIHGDTFADTSFQTLQIRIAPPQITITVTPSEPPVYEGIPVSLNCTATVDRSVVNTQISVKSLVWIGRNGEQLNSSSSDLITVTDMYESEPYTSVLTFDPADNINSGNYQCLVNVVQDNSNPNVLPVMSNATVNLSISAIPDPIVVISTSDLPVAGQNFSLTCTVNTTVDRTGQLTVNWVRNGDMTMLRTTSANLTTASSTILTLPFSPLTFTDRGMYSCVVEFRVPVVALLNVSDSYNLIVDFPLPTVVVQAVNPSVPMVSGTARNLTCTVTLTNVNDINVAVNFTWITNMTELVSASRITTYLTSQSGNLSTFTSTLIFYPLDDSVDSRMYRCNVRVDSAPSSVFITPTTATNTTTIDVQPLPPPIVNVSSTNTMSPGSDVTLTCVVGVVAGLIVPPEIVWTKRAVSSGGDTTLNAISVGPVRTNSTLSLPLMFSPINTSDAGQYTCTATVNVDRINVTVTNNSVVDVRLQIPSPNVSLVLSSANATVAASSTTNQTHLAGSTLNITCDIDIPDSVNTMFTVNMVWTRNGNNPMTFGVGSMMSNMSNTSSEMSDTSSGSATSEMDNSNQSTSPRFVVTPARMTAPNHYQTQLSFSTLSSSTDIGQYVCTISIDSPESLEFVMDSMSASESTNVIVEDPAITDFTVTPPMVAVLESTCLDSQPHDSFTLVCTARKPSVVIPELGVQWLHNGTVRDVRDVVVMATDNGAFITNILNVTDAEVTDAGLYQCVATIMIPDSPTVSTDGSVNVDARAQSLPNTPVVSVDMKTPTTADINIVVANIAYTRETYHVRYNGLERDTDMDRSNTINGTAEITATNSVYTITLTGLEEDTTYNYTVTAGNCIGNTTTAIMNFRTLSARPAASPMNCSSPTFFSTNTTLRWIAPPPIDQNGDIMGYNLTCPNVRTSLSSTLSSPNTTITITAGIVPFTNYSCSLTAINVNGSSPMTNCSFETAQDTPGDAPQNFNSTPTMTSIMYWWTPPTQPNGIITGYTLTAGGGPGEELNATTQSYLLCRLQPGQQVTASIVANTVVGPGPPNSLSISTDPEANSGVANLVARGNGDTMMTITWSPPANRHGFISRYRVNVLNNVTAQRSLTMMETDTMSSFSGMSGVPYYILVYPIDTCGSEGSVMMTINFTKQEQTQGVPEYRTMRSDDGTMLTVSWTPLTLEEARGFITYRVRLILTGDNRRQSPPPPMTALMNESSVTFSGLDPGVRFAVSLDVISSDPDIQPVTPSNLPTVAGTPAPPPIGTIVGVLVALILAIIAAVIIIIIIVILYKRREKKKGQLQFKERLFQPEGVRTVHALSHTEQSVDTGNGLETTLPLTEVNETNEKDKEAKEEAAGERETRMDEEMILERMKPIDKASFHEHVQEMHVNSDAGFEKEYLSIPMQIPGLAFTVSGLDCNKSKNRFANIFPYDHNRVTLEAQEGVEGSDYVNASFVDGYSHPGAYIGAQGPLPTTIGDFWRMIWEYKAVNIVMLTGVVEAGKKKCEQYWPEKVGETLDPRNGLMVTLVSHIPFSDFIIRNLKLSKPADESSKALDVNHFHFTAWPDHGVPQFATSLISFIGRVQKSHKKDLKIPLLVHCSAGVGRTGTFIMLDTIMDRLRSEDSINVYELLLAMRKQRMHMVQTQAQYVFIHDALDELITCGETDIAAGNLRARVNKMHKIVPGKNMSGFSEQFQLLEQVCYKPGDAAFSDSTQPYNLPKNRYPDKLPFNVSRPRLRPDGTNGADYINANFVDGYKQRNAYLVTQGPLKSTVNDLWRMIWEFKSRAIVLLCNTIEEGEEKCYQYWPLQKGETAEFGKLKVTLQSEDPHEEYVIRKLHVCNEKGSKQDSEGVVVTQLHYTAWPEHGHPSSTVHIMELMELLTRVQMKSGNKPITVMCNDGVGRSGTFLCIHSQLERLKTDGEVDAFKYLKTARTRRQGVVAELDHYVFCHEVLADYVESFDPYANFKNL